MVLLSKGASDNGLDVGEDLLLFEVSLNCMMLIANFKQEGKEREANEDGVGGGTLTLAIKRETECIDNLLNHYFILEHNLSKIFTFKVTCNIIKAY